MERIRKRVKEYTGFAVLLILYIAVAVFTPGLSRSQEMIIIGNARLPVSALTGAVSSLSNICIILLVLFYGKTGFIVSIPLLLIQFPLMFKNIIIEGNMGSFPGFFTNLLALIAIIIIHTRNRRIREYQRVEVEQLKEKQQLAQRLFEQTVTALVTAIDAKDEYSHGHSIRVAEYAERIAWMMGKSEEECRKVYYAGLLHDVGKLGISDGIINKKSVLTPEEYEVIKEHPVLGDQILSSITDYPYIRIGAHYHHERYDGLGYPEGLKGKEIPEIARIISVADAYDTLSSNRSYRSAVPQQLIREEIVAGAGTQFDPEIAMIMRHMIDLDSEYNMQEQEAVKELAGDREMHCVGYKSEISEGVIVRQNLTKISLTSRAEDPEEGPAEPAILLFDSLDARPHTAEQEIRDLIYEEFCEIRLGGEVVNHTARAVKTTVTEHAAAAETADRTNWEIEAVKCKDHVLIRVDDGRRMTEVTVAMPDNSRYAYIALTGKNCFISDIHIDKARDPVPDNYIPRIAEAISYLDGPEGDLPNIQVDSARSACTPGVPVTDGMVLSFHTMSLPTARLIWHCPYVVLFHSADGTVNGPDYREYSVVRLDGEDWENEENVPNRVTVTREADFRGWDAWKQGNKAGIDCTVEFRREGNSITVSTRNLGLFVQGVTMFPAGLQEGKGTVYAALTGDQCALTDIRISRKA
ncbi:MAG: HD-GYP domain-containing protein [Clostridiales bacterium]|nr:HD-GYP domain-containing protein [Clostridiales bacterium]